MVKKTFRRTGISPSSHFTGCFARRNDINIKDCFICHPTTLIVFALQWQSLIYIHQTSNVIIKIIHTRLDTAHTSAFSSSANSDTNEDLLRDRRFNAAAKHYMG